MCEYVDGVAPLKVTELILAVLLTVVEVGVGVGVGVGVTVGVALTVGVGVAEAVAEAEAEALAVGVAVPEDVPPPPLPLPLPLPPATAKALVEERPPHDMAAASARTADIAISGLRHAFHLLSVFAVFFKADNVDPLSVPNRAQMAFVRGLKVCQ